MSYKAEVFNVMIASPNDVASERTIIRDVVYEWNAIHSKSQNLVLLPIGWETHSSPEMGDTAQNIINHQVLDKCDLLVGVFWTRLGTPTDNYQSGTVEEIEKHISQEKPTMLYFSSKPVVPDSIDPDQFTQLKQFKNSCKDRGLYQDYDDLSSFKEKFFRHLQLKINEHSLFASRNKNIEENLNIAESQTPFPNLSQEAKILLKEASQDPHGNILYLRVIGGTHIQANGKEFINNKDRREISKWESAIQELIESSLIIERGHKGEIFELTNLGYQIADMVSV